MDTEQDKQEEAGNLFANAKPMTTAELIGFASEVGLSIALPLAGLVFIGHLADIHFNTGHVGLIAGLVFSIVPVSLILLIKIKKILK